MRGVMQFDGGRLIQALDARGMTKTSLCNLINYSSGTVSKWTNGQQYPESIAVQKISDALQIPESWFLKPSLNFGSEVSFFRSNASTTQIYRKKAISHLQMTYECNLELENWIDYPSVFYPRILTREEGLSLDFAEIENIANFYRDQWKLGRGPIKNLIKVLENVGTIIVKEQLGSTNMDGVSKWFFDRPYILISSDKASACRNRFDVAHELAHLVLHKNLTLEDYELGYKRIEDEAHYFASCFLCPSESVSFDLYRSTLDSLVLVKQKWKVSIGALIMRGKVLDIISEEYAERLWRNYSYRKWRQREPLDDSIEQETPSLLSKSIKLLIDEKVFTKQILKNDLSLYDHDIEVLCGLPKGYMSESFGTLVQLKNHIRNNTKKIEYLDSDNKIIKMNRTKL